MKVDLCREQAEFAHKVTDAVLRVAEVWIGEEDDAADDFEAFVSVRMETGLLQRQAALERIPLMTHLDLNDKGSVLLQRSANR